MGCCVSRPQPSPTDHHRPHFVSVGNDNNEQNQTPSNATLAVAEEPSTASASKIAHGDTTRLHHETGSPRSARHDVMPKVKFVVEAASDSPSSERLGFEPTGDENIKGENKPAVNVDKKLHSTYHSRFEGNTTTSLNDTSFRIPQSNSAEGGGDFVGQQTTGGSGGGGAVVSGMDSSLGDSFLPPCAPNSATVPYSSSVGTVSSRDVASVHSASIA